jgi:hypothetical protein
LYRILASIACVTTIGIISPAQATPGYWTKWGTASPHQLNLASNSFDTDGILFNAWIANLPQFLLSFSYFAINRLCTSICFANEWNSYGITKKGLRTTSPKGQQRRTYFLQLPYRWAVPLTATSGFLHWLLSQSLFLVRLEIRDTNGTIIESESRCTCGYSPISIMTFCLVFVILLLVVFRMLLRTSTLNLPAAAHCSLVISAACHAPPSDNDPQLKRVQWGVVRNRFGAIDHCSFTSEDVTRPVEGNLYS